MNRPAVLMLSQEVHPIPPLKGAAVEQWIDAVAHGMAAYHPVVASPPHPARPLREQVDVVSYERVAQSALYKRLFRKITRLDPWPYIQRVIQRARPYMPKVIHVHNAPTLIKPLREAFPSAQLILHMHNEKQLPSDLAIDCLVGCSDYICRWFAEQVNWTQRPRFAQIRNGVNVEQFQPRWVLGQDKIRALKVAQQIPLDRINLLYVGRISPEKGPDLLVDALRQLDPTRYHLTLVGEWPQGDASKNQRVQFAAALRQQMEGLPVTVIPATAPGQMAQIYPLGDLMVIPSRFEEPFSMVAIEAMASGVPVMALRRGGMVEYMVDGENACLLSPETTGVELAAAIDRACAQPGQLELQARAAREMVEKHYDWQQVVIETEALYASLLQKREF